MFRQAFLSMGTDPQTSGDLSAGGYPGSVPGGCAIILLVNWRDAWRNTVHNEEELIRFVDAVGFCAINELERFPEFPNLSLAMGRREALWHAWWWKDDLHVQKRVYYTRLFAGRPGFISLGWLPAFVAANGVAADEVFLLGALPVLAKEVYRIIEARGPISSRPLKKLLSPEVRRSVTGILWELERRFIITKTDITGRELSTYSYVWDLAERWLPDAFIEADRLHRKAAVARISERLEALGVALEPKLLHSVLRWEV